jgi:hypothetical protein
MLSGKARSPGSSTTGAALAATVPPIAMMAAKQIRRADVKQDPLSLVMLKPSLLTKLFPAL